MPRIQHKRGTSANLASVNPTPLAGELVWDSTENAIKIGDGATAWTSLAYVTATPRSHVHDGGDITTGTVAYARLPVGSTTSTVCAGDDARLTDARTPTAHKSTHATGGSDALTPGDIGAAPAASPTFTGVITVSATSGSAGSYAPSVTFSGDSNTGFGQVSGQSDTASIFTAGHERVRVDASGRVGIGTTPTSSPSGQSALDVNGPLVARGRISTSQTGAAVLEINGSLCQLRAYGATAGSGVLDLRTGGGGGSADAAAVRIDSTQRVGIGTGTGAVTALLDINSDKIRLRTAKTPASASDTGNAGDICWDASYLYICTATNTWRRIAHSTW